MRLPPEESYSPAGGSWPGAWLTALPPVPGTAYLDPKIPRIIGLVWS